MSQALASAIDLKSTESSAFLFGQLAEQSVAMDEIREAKQREARELQETLDGWQGSVFKLGEYRSSWPSSYLICLYLPGGTTALSLWCITSLYYAGRLVWGGAKLVVSVEFHDGFDNIVIRDESAGFELRC